MAPEAWRDRPWRVTRHAGERCAERRIPEPLLSRALPLADLCRAGRDGALKLALSRRALKRAGRDQELAPHLEVLGMVVIVVEDGGAVMSTWRGERRRRPHARETQM